jgi:hypothetical protein
MKELKLQKLNYLKYRVQSNMKELKLQKLNYLKYRADGLYDSQNEKNNSS